MEDVENVDIVVRVLGSPKYDRHGNFEVPIRNETGQIADLRVWEKHQKDSEWRVGSKYSLKTVKKHPPEARKARYESSAKIQISRKGLPNNPEVSLLHVSDTHIGRPLTDKKHIGAGNQLNRFLDAVNYAMKHRVDGILHTGDFFDDEVSEKTVTTVEKQIALLSDVGIPFYYVRGNHGCDRGDAFLQSQTKSGRMIHLSNEPQILGGETLALYGMDADAMSHGISRTAPTGDPPQNAYRLLAWHEAVKPLARNGVPIQRVSEASDVELNALALGDLHKNKREYLDKVRRACGQRLRLFYAGATTKIAKNIAENEPAVWLLQIVDGALERHRLPLRNK